MKYALLIYETAELFEARSAPRGEYMEGHDVFGQLLLRADIAATGRPLMPPEAATTIRVRGGLRQVVDGPFADTKEQLGGFVIIDVPDLDAAIAWAEKCPTVKKGAIEIRPVAEGGI